jgi:hypothetical protein
MVGAQEAATGALVVRGRVVAQESFWSADGSRIESRSTVSIRYALGGEAGVGAGQIAVHTVGGQLPNGLGMVASHVPALTPGEEVILFLQRSPLAGENGYEITDDERGKFTVRDGRIVFGGTEGTEESTHPAAAAALSLEDFYNRLRDAGLAAALPADWQAREQAPLAVAGAAAGEAMTVGSSAAGGYTINGYKWPTDTVTYKVNVNTTQTDGGTVSGGDFLAAIRRAANTWTYVEEADISLVYEGQASSTRPGFNGANEILFVDEGTDDGAGSSLPLATTLVFYMNGTIVEADIKVNDAYVWSAAGSPPAAAYDLQSLLLHEMGHLLGLGHDEGEQAAMFDSIAPGTTKRGLGENDRQGVAAVYPCAAGELCNPEAGPDPAFAPEVEAVEPPAEAPTPAPPAAPVTPEPAANHAVYLPLVQGGS